MLKEMHEQPEALSRSIAGRIDGDDRIGVDELEPVVEDAPRRATRVELIACGSADYAALVGGARLLEEWAGLPARWNIGSEFRYSPPPLDARTLVIAVTQSGETADTIAPPAWPARRAARSSRSPTPSARPSPARRMRCCSSRPAPRSRSWRPRPS